ncbi:hypothetical protein K2173_018978 [Erythroxylum novogranatense]|uniref:CRM domain-containing protein n=1 Tax=Erythroxylum novogranatense TaxID=1862640 RepID=A0AAV8ST11_9ROSI|nr:hypothetical protein K2173_018978 [Erythroxylum novogranatense]
MAKALLRGIQRASSILKPLPSLKPSSLSWQTLQCQEIVFSQSRHTSLPNPTEGWWDFRNLSYGRVNLVMSEGKPKFEIHEVDPPKKDKWKTKKRFKMQRKREKQKRKAANKKDPRRLTVKGKKKRFDNAEDRIKYRLEKAKIKEALLIERLKHYEVPKAQGPEVHPHYLTGEERHYLKKMAQKKSNYVPVGRRGIFGGLILNMHMHWKKHETVKVICKPCKPGQVHEYAREITRLSGGIAIQIIGDDTIIFYRGKDYVQPEVMSPIDTLSKKKALEKSKYEQSLESVRHFIAVSEKELELYYRHNSLCASQNNNDPAFFSEEFKESGKSERESSDKIYNVVSHRPLKVEIDSTDQEVSETDDGFEDGCLSMSASESDSEDILNQEDLEVEGCPSTNVRSSTILRPSSLCMNYSDTENEYCLEERNNGHENPT